MNAYFSSLKIFTATQCHCQMSGVEPTESEEKVPGASVHSTVVTVEGEEEEEEDPCDVDDPDYEPYFHLTAILPDECITEMEEAAFMVIEFGELVPTTRFWKLFGQLGAAPRCFLTLGFEGRTGILEGNDQTLKRGTVLGVGYSPLDRDHPAAMEDRCA
nr:hypothetical protein BaRGS_017331 [Batillaria attramentaria]